MIDVEVVVDDLPCHRCGDSLILAIRVPHGFHRADGELVSGTRTVPLCRVCDRDDPVAQGVLAFFAFHEQIDATTVGEGGTILTEWIDTVSNRPTPYLDHLNAEDHPDAPE
ncbi:DUF6300 family protein [Nocardia sp. NPDC056952]|uniref:DUF6300 family protein n=1 Tax=Nocardia sp. NPDC056952 TaxID=3345979 RepID=UPI0036283DDC